MQSWAKLCMPRDSSVYLEDILEAIASPCVVRQKYGRPPTDLTPPMFRSQRLIPTAVVVG